LEQEMTRHKQASKQASKQYFLITKNSLVKGARPLFTKTAPLENSRFLMGLFLSNPGSFQNLTLKTGLGFFVKEGDGRCLR